MDTVREIDRTATTHDIDTVVWQSPGGARISICTACERKLRDAREWPKDARGEEYCQVHRGRAPDACDYATGAWREEADVFPPVARNASP